METLANLLAAEGLSEVPVSASLAAGLWDCDALLKPALCSLAWRTCGTTLAAVVLVKSSTEKSVALYHVRRSLAGKAVGAGPGVVVEAACVTTEITGARHFDVEAAFSQHGISHMLSTAIPGIRTEGENKGAPIGALTIGFADTDAPDLRVKEALLELAAELAHTLPQHMSGLLKDICDLCPAVSTCGGGCACGRASAAKDETLLANLDACRKPYGGRPDDDASSGATASSGSSGAALKNVSVSSPAGIKDVTDGSTSAESENSDSPRALKRRLRCDRLMATVYAQDPVWLTFKDPEVEQGFLLHCAKRACGQDLSLLLVMIIYLSLVEFWRPFYFASLDPGSVYVYLAFVATFAFLCKYQDWYIKNRAIMITLWQMALRYYTFRVGTVIAATPSDAATQLATQWLWVFPVAYGFDSIVFVLTVKHHLYLRTVLSVMGCATASQVFPRGWRFLPSAVASTWSIINILIAEVVCLKLNSKWEAEARMRFAKARASRSLLTAAS